MSESTRLLGLLLRQSATRHPGGVWAFVAAASALIAQGVDFTAHDEHGHTVFQALSSQPTNSDAYGGVLAAMLAAGANPLADGGAYFREVASQGAAVYALLDSLAKYQNEGGVEHFDEEGNNPLHLLAVEDLRRLDLVLLRLAKYTQAPGALARISHWTKQSRVSDDSTLLHLVWAQPALIASLRLEQDRVSLDKVAAEVANRVWSISQRLTSSGMDFFARNLAGERPVDAMVRAHASGAIPMLPEYRNLWTPLLARLQQEVLEQGTPSVAPRSAVIARL